MHGKGLAAVAVVLAIASALTAQTPQTAVTLTTKPSPLGLGQNLFEVTVKNAKGQPVAGADVMLVLLMPADPKTKHPEMRTEGKLNALGRGRYNGIVLVTMAGEWDVSATVLRNGKQIGQVRQRLTAVTSRSAAPKSPEGRKPAK